MATRRTTLSLILIRLLTMSTCVCLDPHVSVAQTDVQSHLQIVPPPIPRYRRVRPAFEIKADPAQKPLPTPVYIPPPVSLSTPAEPTVVRPKEDPQKRMGRLRDRQRNETINQLSHDRLVGVGKALGFVLVVGVGIAAAADIVQQFRKAKRTQTLLEVDDTNEWEP